MSFDLVTHNAERFNALVRKPEKKKRKCLKCGKAKVMMNDNRVCALCSQENDKYNFRAESVSSDHNYSTQY